MRANGDSGMPLQVSGTVYDIRGESYPTRKSRSGKPTTSGATTSRATATAPSLNPGAKGAYAIESVMPGTIRPGCASMSTICIQRRDTSR